MTIISIKNPPENADSFVRVEEGLQQNEFVEKIVALLRQGTLSIVTNPVPLSWVEQVYHYPGLHRPTTGYRVLAQETSPCGGRDSAELGVIYFERVAFGL